MCAQRSRWLWRLAMHTRTIGVGLLHGSTLHTEGSSLHGLVFYNHECYGESNQWLKMCINFLLYSDHGLCIYPMMRSRDLWNNTSCRNRIGAQRGQARIHFNPTSRFDSGSHWLCQNFINRCLNSPLKRYLRGCKLKLATSFLRFKFCIEEQSKLAGQEVRTEEQSIS
ncbi:hypothetical protein VNO77_07628 [Canavalia gladiata]|uniref:Secreted protein n=1 Tax=Canavalia gladiata TaxID=3824 RepID=A0AAN9M8R0_CANGL